MTEEKIELAETPEEKEPLYFVPRRVSLISDTANILSWIILVGFIGDTIAEIIGLRAQLVANSITLQRIIAEPSFYVYIFSNILVPLLTGLGFFAVLQAGSLGLSMLLEWDFERREGKK